jgi:adenosylmethionine-8-amino-7-oxononanoate aminotransferase
METDELIRLRRLDRTAVWHGFTQMAEYEPLVIERAEGCWLTDIEGRRLLDGVSSLWCNVHGHQHPKINQAIRDQLDRVAHVTGLGMSNIPAIHLAEKLLSIAPPSLKHVFYECDGSSAVEVAIKMAYQYWRHREGPLSKRNTFIAMGEAYHGDTVGGVSLGGMDVFHRVFRKLLFNVIRGPCPSLFRIPANVRGLDPCEDYLQQIEQILSAHADEIVAVVIEPLVQGAAGIIVHPRGFLTGVRELTMRYGVLLICDEIATGFGRTGKMFACEHEGVAPDLMCIGKGLTGGYLPMAATLASGEVFDAFLGKTAEGKQFFHGHTFGGNPLAAAAALASIDLFHQEHTLANVAERALQVAQRLQLLVDHPHVGDIRQLGLMIGIELVADRATNSPFPSASLIGRRVCRKALENGVWIRPLGDVLVLMPPLSIRADEIDFLLEVVEGSIHDTLLEASK